MYTLEKPYTEFQVSMFIKSGTSATVSRMSFKESRRTFLAPDNFWGIFLGLCIHKWAIFIFWPTLKNEKKSVKSFSHFFFSKYTQRLHSVTGGSFLFPGGVSSIFNDFCQPELRASGHSSCLHLHSLMLAFRAFLEIPLADLGFVVFPLSRPPAGGGPCYWWTMPGWAFTGWPLTPGPSLWSSNRLSSGCLAG